MTIEDHPSPKSAPELCARAIALHLPQFHPCPENDEWWEPGFTEWTNSTKARPLFPGHYQPHLPADLGFYDLRLPEAREAQAALARSYGVEAFCFYHYWFGNGRRLLDRPVSDMLASGRPDFPFMLCWANQTWTGVWHGAPNRVLIQQTYPGRSDYEAHFRQLLPMFNDSRYVRVDGKPAFIVYRPNELPNALEFADIWRELAQKSGLPGLYLLGEHRAAWDFQKNGFDGCVLSRLPPKRREWTPWSDPGRKITGKILDIVRLPTVHRYEKLKEYIVPAECASDRIYPCVIPNWDNTPRSGHAGMLMLGSTPELFGQQVARATNMLSNRTTDQRLLFIKSWNEWGEGNHLEPDRRYGRRYLEELKAQLSNG